MEYKIEETQEELNKLHQALKLGLELKDALIYAGIKIHSYSKWLKYYKLKKYIDYKRFSLSKDYDEDSLKNFYGELEVPEQKDIDLYNEDDDFRKYVNQCHALVNEIDRDKISLKGKLLADVLGANSKSNKNWAASKWMLEQLDPTNFAKGSIEPEEKQKVKGKIEVEYVSPEDGNNKIKEIEEQIINEMNSRDDMKA